MIKFILLSVLTLVVQLSFGANSKWSSQETNKRFKSSKLINLFLNDKKIELPQGTSFELFEVSDLNMIKVHLHKYKINNCPSSSEETDLQLVDVDQGRRRKKSVGVNLTKGCVVEIFIDMEEYNTLSFLQ